MGQGKSYKNSGRSGGWLILLAIVLVNIAILLYYTSANRPQVEYDNSGLNLSTPPKLETPPTPHTTAPAANPPPRFNPSPAPGTISTAPPAPRRFQRDIPQRPEWVQASASFAQLARSSKYRNSAVLRAWARDFAAYPDLHAIGKKFLWDRDLLFFTVAVLRSTNFAKMLRKYGSSPDVKNFYLDLLSSPGAGPTSRALFEDPRVMNSIQDLAIPGLPSLGQMMRNGAQAPSAQSNEAVLRKIIRDSQRGAQP